MKKNALIDEIADIAERAYKRGYQQGFHNASKDGPKPTLHEVAAWRFFKNLKSKNIAPPGSPYKGAKESKRYRLELELTGDHPGIREMIEEERDRPRKRCRGKAAAS